MGKRKASKRKLKVPVGSELSSRVEVIVEDLSSHPVCPHGPTLLFSCERGDFYACASCRGRECAVRISKASWEDPRVRLNNNKYRDLPPAPDKEASWSTYQKLLESTEPLAYCVSCDEVLAETAAQAHAAHRVVAPLGRDQLARPSSWLPALDRDTTQAQYFFSSESVQTILSFIGANNIKNVICMGTPTIHEAVMASARDAGGPARSLLLELDARLLRWWPPRSALHYNMFNHHFLGGPADRRVFDDFLESSRETGVCVVLDPPFGGRVEPLAHTLRLVTARYNQLTARQHSLLPVVWAFPYFSEPYITNQLPDLLMHHYQVTYTNHSKFSRATAGGRGSPVRLFSNLPRASLSLAHDAAYRHCAPCAAWVLRSSEHCAACGACPARGAARYRHCVSCARCVKASYQHCAACGRCARRDHECGAAPPPAQTCYNCKEKGHKKSDCPLLGTKHNKHKKKR